MLNYFYKYPCGIYLNTNVIKCKYVIITLHLLDGNVDVDWNASILRHLLHNWIHWQQTGVLVDALGRHVHTFGLGHVCHLSSRPRVE